MMTMTMTTMMMMTTRTCRGESFLSLPASRVFLVLRLLILCLPSIVRPQSLDSGPTWLTQDDLSLSLFLNPYFMCIDALTDQKVVSCRVGARY